MIDGIGLAAGFAVTPAGTPVQTADAAEPFRNR